MHSLANTEIFQNEKQFQYYFTNCCCYLLLTNLAKLNVQFSNCALKWETTTTNFHQEIRVDVFG